MSCSGAHLVPKQGFLENGLCQHQLDLEINKINLNLSQFKEYHKIIQDLNENFEETETIQKDPENYIHEYFAEQDKWTCEERL